MLIPFSLFRELLHPKTTHFSTIFSVYNWSITANLRIFLHDVLFLRHAPYLDTFGRTIGENVDKTAFTFSARKKKDSIFLKIFFENEFSLPTAQATSVPPSAQASCNFDYGLCHGWSQSSSDIFDWRRQRGSTSSSNTGPSSDHTTGNGTYNTVHTYIHTCMHTFVHRIRFCARG